MSVAEYLDMVTEQTGCSSAGRQSIPRPSREEWEARYKRFEEAIRTFGPTPRTPPLSELDREHIYADDDE